MFGLVASKPQFEGNLLRSLYCRLLRIDSNPLAINMNLTEALLKIMRIAHPLIDNYFFNNSRFESSEFQYFDEVLSEVCRLNLPLIVFTNLKLSDFK